MNSIVSELSELVYLVEGMRKLQVEYFKSRDRLVLIKSKELEKEVDKKVKEIKEAMESRYG